MWQFNAIGAAVDLFAAFGIGWPVWTPESNRLRRWFFFLWCFAGGLNVGLVIRHFS
jgi:hypothetical protein